LISEMITKAQEFLTADFEASFYVTSYLKELDSSSYKFAIHDI